MASSTILALAFSNKILPAPHRRGFRGVRHGSEFTFEFEWMRRVVHTEHDPLRAQQFCP